MAYVSDSTSSHSSNTLENDLTKQSELDFIPTKITAIEPDPTLFVTPEKRSLLKTFKTKKPVVPHKASLISPDPHLIVTPEKMTSVLKNVKKGQESAPVTKNKVRFNIPDSSEDNTTSTLSLNTQSTLNDSSTLSTEFEEGSSQTTEDTSDFATKAALYTQRNPLADITIDHNSDFLSSTGSGTSTSLNSSSEKSFPKLFDMKGRKFTQTQSAGSVIEPTTKLSAVTKITTTRHFSHRKNTPIQLKIDKLTTQLGGLDGDLLKEVNAAEKPTYLKKKSGLHRHQHSVRYLNKEKNSLATNSFEIPKYNSTVALGQKLQQIKDEKFDAFKVVAKKVETDADLKTLVETKAASGTNVDPEEALFSNLIGIDVEEQDVLAAPEFRRVKRPQLVKSCPVQEPDIMEVFPSDLIQERPVLDSRCYSLPNLELLKISLSSVMALYEHSLSWY